jgi:hypothetical protein
VELVDREEYRDAIAASLDEQVDREANALIREMGEILRNRSRITRRQRLAHPRRCSLGLVL